MNRDREWDRGIVCETDRQTHRQWHWDIEKERENEINGDGERKKFKMFATHDMVF